MILVTNFTKNSTKYYVCKNADEHQAAVLEIIRDFFNVYALEYSQLDDFLKNNSISMQDRALASLKDDEVAILPRVLREKAEELREQVTFYTENWNFVKSAFLLAEKLISLPKDEALVYRDPKFPLAPVLNILESSLTMLLTNRVFYSVLEPKLYTQIKETSY